MKNGDGNKSGNYEKGRLLSHYEMCDSKYCENTCVYTCPQKECYLQYLECKEQEDAENI